MARAAQTANPFASRVPKPKILDLLRLITSRQRMNYVRIARALKRLPGVHAELNYYGKTWGWALRYRRGDATLCTMHFLPRRFDATVTVPRGLEDWAMGPNHLSRITKRDLRSLEEHTHTKLLQMPLGSMKRSHDLIRMVRFKVSGK